MNILSDKDEEIFGKEREETVFIKSSVTVIYAILPLRYRNP